MRSMSFYDKLSELNNALYDGASDFNGWRLLDTFADKTGLYIAIYDIGNNETLFAIKGTDFDTKHIKDTIVDVIGNDLFLWAGFAPAQAFTAHAYYNRVKNKYSNVIFTGYSLGGSIAQLLGVAFGNEVITFEAYGVGHIANRFYKSNIISFGNKADPIFMINFLNQIGTIYMMDTDNSWGMNNHFYGNYGKPSHSKKLEIPKAKYLLQLKQTAPTKTKTVESYLRNSLVLGN